MELKSLEFVVASRRWLAPIARVSLLGAGVACLVFLAPRVGSVPENTEATVDAEPTAPPEEPFRQSVSLRRGDTLLGLLTRSGLERPAALELIDKLRPALNLRKLTAGEQLELVLHPTDKTVQGMEMVVGDRKLLVTATEEGWQVEDREIPLVRETRGVHGAIASSLYQSGTAAGLMPQHILDLARVFEYDVDFFSDFQAGDKFSVLVEDLRYGDGRRLPGKVLAAQLEADGRPYSAFYFSGPNDEGAYYDYDGRAVRRSFLRAPLSYARISSPFSLKRRHPIFRTLRPHRAIDYAAPAGTPVVAIGAGRVVFSGWRGGYGKLVEIRHDGGYTSRYGHFSRIAKGIRPGSRVAAGDVIGYVGQTGHATGPHLHFEFLRGREKINFLALKLPRIERLEGPDLQRFLRERDQRLAILDGQRSDLASLQSDS